MGQRRNNGYEMSIVEHLEKMRDDVCTYACKHWEHAEEEAKKNIEDFEKCNEINMQLHEYCEDCPFRRIGEL